MDSALRVALAHPRRVEILSLLQERQEATDRQLAEAVGIAPSLARYHLKGLSNAELIVLVPRAAGAGQSYAASAGR